MTIPGSRAATGAQTRATRQIAELPHDRERTGRNVMKAYQVGQRIVRNRFAERFKPLVVDGLAYEGLSYLQLDHERPDGTGFHTLTMAPGAASLPQRHTSDEIFYVVEGDLVDFDDTHCGADDMVLLRAGTIHKFCSPAGCMLISYMDSLETAAE
jgi:mannose-6-phosphate isomerase-like protein (cupin superfamily)